MKPRRRRKFRSAMQSGHAESLEVRALLTGGNVLASVNGSALELTGDSDNNEIQVTTLPSGQISVVGRNGTTVNGQGSFVSPDDSLTIIRADLSAGDDSIEIVDAQVNQNINISTGAGGDFVRVVDSEAQSVVVRSGSGGDTIEIDGVTASQNVDVGGNRGRDVIRVLNSSAGNDVRATTGLGQDIIRINNVDVSADIEVQGDRGTDVIEVSESTADGDLQVSTGAGRDTVGVVSVELGGAAEFRSGAGADIVAFADLDVLDRLFVNAASGADFVSLAGTNNFDGEFTANGGNGNDTSGDTSNSSFDQPPQFNNFESDQLSAEDIQTGLTAFADAGLTIGQALFGTPELPDSNNVAFQDEVAFLALGTEGIGATNPATGQLTVVDGGRVDDLSVADGFLFTLDAVGGTLSVYDLRDNPLAPELVVTGVSVPVSPFAGVSAAGGRIVVSGGTGLLTVRTYDTDSGQLSEAFSSADLGVGQPDVLLSADGSQALVSTDFSGTVDGVGFGITVIDLNDPPTPPETTAQIGLPGSGFTGGSGPANFAIESALLPGNFFLTAHGGGLTLSDRATGEAIVTLDVGFGGINVDTVGSVAYVVGDGQLREVDFTNVLNPILGPIQDIGGNITGVAANDEFIVLSANAGGTLVLPR